VELGELGEVFEGAREISKTISHYIERFKGAKASDFMRERFDSIAVKVKATETGELWERRRDIWDVVIGDREDFEVGEL